MPISMDIAAHYKLQTSFYQRMQVGRPLSDRRIEEYRRQGYYGNGILALAEKVAKTRRQVFELKDFI